MVTKEKCYDSPSSGKSWGKLDGFDKFGEK